MGEKVSKETAQYRKARAERRCGNCVAFDLEHRGCAIVEGTIEPQMCCDRWRPLKHGTPGAHNS